MEKAKKYLAAAYLRLSDADKEQGESNSIINQRRLIQEFVKGKEDLCLCGEWVDDGVSGASFERPAFQEMMEEIHTGKINCIIVKDLSRFGRNYIEAGNFLERLFPVLGVRFIAINDSIDSNRQECQQDFLTVPFLNLLNDAYLRDISIKIRSQFALKRKNGEFIGAFAAYGYQKDPENKNHLVIDPYASQIVRQIFFWSLSGVSTGGIAAHLESFGILSPYAYKMAQGYRYMTGFQTHRNPRWTPSAVKRILTNEVYLGHIVQGKMKTPNYRVKKKFAVPEKDWVIVCHMHEAILSEKTFALVQRRLALDTRTAPKQGKIYPLSGMLFCSACAQLLSRKLVTASGKKYPYYVCSTYKRDRLACSSHSIHEQQILEVIQKSIQKFCLIALGNYIAISERVWKKKIEWLQRQAYWYAIQIKRMLREQREKEQRQESIKKDMLQGKIQEKEFAAFSGFYSTDHKLLEQRIGELRQKEEQRRTQAQRLKQGQEKEKVPAWSGEKIVQREFLILVIEKLTVYEKNRICIHFRFQCPVARL